MWLCKFGDAKIYTKRKDTERQQASSPTFTYKLAHHHPHPPRSFPSPCRRQVRHRCVCFPLLRLSCAGPKVEGPPYSVSAITFQPSVRTALFRARPPFARIQKGCVEFECLLSVLPYHTPTYRKRVHFAALLRRLCAVIIAAGRF